MLCKIGTKKHSRRQETEAKSDESNKIPKTKHACIVDNVWRRLRKRFTVVRWNPMNPRDKERNLRSPKIMKVRIQFDDPLQFGAQDYADASGDENSGCESSSGQGVEDAPNDSSLAVGRSKEQKARLFWKHEETKRKSTLLH